MTARATRILVYDGDCSMCTKLSRVAEWRWLVGDAGRRPHDSFEGDDAVRLTEAGIHNELAVIDTSSGEIRSGYDGIVSLMRGGKLPWLGALLSFGPIRWFFRHDYRLVAYNRRIFAPVKRTAVCACDPDVHRGYRWAFIAAALLWTVLFGAMGGVMFATERPFFDDLPPTQGPAGTWWTGPLLLLGWLATALTAARLPSPRGLDLLGHLAWTLAAMVLPCIVAIFLVLGGLLIVPGDWALDPAVPRWTGAIAWALALPVALWACRRRLPLLGLHGAAVYAHAAVLWGLPATAIWLLLVGR